MTRSETSASRSEAGTPLAAGQAVSPARFTGALADLSIADLIQILQLAGKGAAITVTRDGLESHLWCSDGAVIDAQSGCLRGETAVYRMLGFEQGSLVADLQAVPRVRKIFAATQRLLLEAARRKDESGVLREKLGDEQTCYRLREGLALEQLSVSPIELCLLRSFAEARSLAEVFESSELGDFETLTALCAWIEAGHLVVEATRRALPPKAADHQSAAPPQAVTLRPLVASVRPPQVEPRRAGVGSWAWGALAALLLAPGAYLIGAQTAHQLEPAAAPTVAAALQPAPAIPQPYVLALHVEPAQAEIWMDGERVAVGSYETVLTRDGVAHAVRVSAPGFVPATFVFLDAPPARDVRLEPLPPTAAVLPRAKPSDRAAPAIAPSPTDAAGAPAKARKRAVPARSTARGDAVRTGLRPRSRVAGSVASVTQVDDAQSVKDDQIVRLLD